MSGLFAKLCLGLLAGCVSYTHEVRLKTPFDPASVQWSTQEGANRIQGTALLRTRGGDVRTCAALGVLLIPLTVYAKERALHIFGDAHGGFNSIGLDGRHPVFVNEHPEYGKSIRATKCDAQGHFEFPSLPDGEWYVATSIVWEVPGIAPQGGELMGRYRVTGGKTARVVLAY